MRAEEGWTPGSLCFPKLLFVRCQSLMRDCCGSRLRVDLAIPDVLFSWPRQHQAESFSDVWDR